MLCNIYIQGFFESPLYLNIDWFLASDRSKAVFRIALTVTSSSSSSLPLIQPSLFKSASKLLILCVDRIKDYCITM